MSNTFKHQLARKLHKLDKTIRWTRESYLISAPEFNRINGQSSKLVIEGAGGFRYGNQRKRVSYMKVSKRRAERKKLNCLQRTESDI